MQTTALIKEHFEGVSNSYALTDNGDGTLDWSSVDVNEKGKTIIDRSNPRYLIGARYLGTALHLKDEAEKNVIDLDVKAVDQAFLEESTSNGSPDTNRVRISGERVRRIFTSGNDTSSVVDLNIESVLDFGKNITLHDGSTVPDPAIFLKSGKANVLQGEVRSYSGRNLILIDRDSSLANDGAFINNFYALDNCYGTILHARRCKGLYGTLYARNCHDARPNSQSSVTTACASVRIDEVTRSNFNVNIKDSDATFGLHIGDAAQDLSPNVGFTMLNNSVIMKNGQGVALAVEKLEKGFLQFTQLEGDIYLGEHVNDVTIQLPSVWEGSFNLTAHENAEYKIIDFAGNVLSAT